MATNPYPPLPYGKNGGDAMQQFPSPKLALEEYSSENQVASSVITVTQDTTALEITAIGQGAVMRWVTTADTQASVISDAGSTANFDHVIPPNSMRQFAIPIEGPIFTAPSSMVGANRQNSLYRRVAIKSLGIGSVLLSEF